MRNNFINHQLWYGIGMTFAGEFSHYFGVLDMNNVWTYMTNFEKPVKTGVLSPRLGRTFQIKRAESNFGIWVGAMRVKLGGVTSGNINTYRCKNSLNF